MLLPIPLPQSVLFSSLLKVSMQEMSATSTLDLALVPVSNFDFMSYSRSVAGDIVTFSWPDLLERSSKIKCNNLSYIKAKVM
jgi:hypothetical protein